MRDRHSLPAHSDACSLGLLRPLNERFENDRAQSAVNNQRRIPSIAQFPGSIEGGQDIIEGQHALLP